MLARRQSKIGAEHGEAYANLSMRFLRALFNFAIAQSGGVQLIYFNRLANGEIWLILIYPKNKQDSIDAKILKEIKHEIEKTIDR